MEEVIMSIKNLKRFQLIQKVVERVITQKKAAELLDLSTRQLRRITQRFKTEGASALIHKSKGKLSNRKHSDQFKQKILKLYQNDYSGFGPTLASEKLLERNKIKVARETLRRWLLKESLWQTKKKIGSHHMWRERKECFGEMIQMDGSHHDWLEKRAPKFVLMGFIDDATNEVYGRFYDYEGTIPAMHSFYHYILKYGLPQSVYLDRHTTYKSTGKPTLEDELKGKSHFKSQFERALETLGVTVIHAYSPQAKGRIERQFGTFQDRLVKEMRLQGINTKEEANQFLKDYLPKYNLRFRVSPKNDLNLHRKAPKQKILKRILSIHESHTLRNDNTIKRNGRLYLVLNDWKAGRPKEIETEEHIDGKVSFMNQERRLKVKEIDGKPKLILKPSSQKKPPIPELDHPWRKFVINRYSGMKTIEQITENQLQLVS